MSRHSSLNSRTILYTRFYCCIAVMNEWKTILLIKFKSLFFITWKVKIGCKCERKVETKDSDKGWQKTAILTIFRAPIGVSSASSARSVPPRRWRPGWLLLWLDCSSHWRLTNCSIRVYIISQRPRVLVFFSAVNPRDMLPLFYLHCWNIIFKKSLIEDFSKIKTQHPSSSHFSKCTPVDIFFTSLSIPLSTLILQKRYKDNNSNKKQS